MAISSIGARGSGVSGSSGTTVTQTPGATVAVGRILFVFVTYRNTGALTVTVDDAVGGNTYEELAHHSTSDANVAVFMCTVATQLISTTVITATFSSAVVDKCMASWEYSVGASNVLVESAAEVGQVVDPAGNGFGSASHSGLSSLSRLYLRCGAKRANSTTTITATTNFTSWGLNIRSRNNTNAIIARAEHRINTSTGETSNPTLAVSGISASEFLALEEQTPAINGSASITLGELTASGAGTAPTAGSASVTLDALTSSSAGTVVVAGQGSPTLDALTVSGQGTVADSGVNGSANITLDALTASGAGTAPIAGQAAVTLGDLTAVGAGTVPIVGQGSTTLGAVTTVGVGTVAVAGQGAPTLGALTSSGAGTVKVAGSASIALGDLGVSGAGAVPVVGGLTATLGPLVVAGTGGSSSAVNGSAAITLGALTLAGAGSAPATGSFSQTLGALTLSSSGTAPIAGVCAATLGALTCAGTGTVSGAGAPVVVSYFEFAVRPCAWEFSGLDPSGIVAESVDPSGTPMHKARACEWGELLSTGIGLDPIP